MQPIFYCICRGVQNQSMIRISHIVKVIPTTLAQIYAIHMRECGLLAEQGAYDIHTLIIDRPADLAFLQQLAKADSAKEK